MFLVTCLQLKTCVCGLFSTCNHSSITLSPNAGTLAAGERPVCVHVCVRVCVGVCVRTCVGVCVHVCVRVGVRGERACVWYVLNTNKIFTKIFTNFATMRPDAYLKTALLLHKRSKVNAHITSTSMEPITIVAGLGLISSVLGVVISYGTVVERSTKLPVIVNTLMEGQRHISDDIERLEKRIDRLEQKLDHIVERNGRNHQ